MQTFQPGQTYMTRSIGDHNCIIAVTVTKRTAKTVTVTMPTGGDKTQTFRPAVYGDAEFIRPWGSYSMAPILRATDTKILKRDWE